MSALALAAAHPPRAIRSELPTGALHLELEQGATDLASLLDFAARANPKRAFLFLSKVLGKHYPSIPSEMACVHRQLAATVPHTEGPVVFIGMAETATGLGQGVFEAWAHAHPGSNALYLQTTRYRVPGADWLGFDESHSHAPRLFLHLPQHEASRVTLAAARQVVLVDDELSTGNTFVNLVSALRCVMPSVSRVHIATISDFMGRERRTRLSERMGSPCTIGALLRGAWNFEYRHCAATDAFVTTAAAQCSAGHEVQIEDAGYGRLGRTDSGVRTRSAGRTLSLRASRRSHSRSGYGRIHACGFRAWDGTRSAERGCSHPVDDPLPDPAVGRGRSHPSGARPLRGRHPELPLQRAPWPVRTDSDLPRNGTERLTHGTGNAAWRTPDPFHLR